MVADFEASEEMDTKATVGSDGWGGLEVFFRLYFVTFFLLIEACFGGGIDWKFGKYSGFMGYSIVLIASCSRFSFNSSVFF